jgi:hypothetical protein
VSGVVERGSPARVVAAAAGALRPPPPDGSLSLAAHGVQRGVGAADEVEVIDDDPGVRQFGADRLPVSVMGVDRDDLDRPPVSLRERLQPALHGAAAAAVEDVDDAAAVQVRYDGRQLAPAPVRGLIERQPPRRSPLARRQQLVAAVGEHPRHLIARGVLVARELGMRCALAATLEQPGPEAGSHALAGRQLRVSLGERAPARLTVEAALAPRQIPRTAGDRQIAHPHHRPLLDRQ